MSGGVDYLEYLKTVSKKKKMGVKGVKQK